MVVVRMDDQNKNLILATALSFFVILGWYVGGPILFPSWFPEEVVQPHRNRDDGCRAFGGNSSCGERRCRWFDDPYGRRRTRGSATVHRHR